MCRLRRAHPEVVIAKMTPINDDPHSIPVYGNEDPRQKEYPETWLCQARLT